MNWNGLRCSWAYLPEEIEWIMGRIIEPVVVFDRPQDQLSGQPAWGEVGIV